MASQIKTPFPKLLSLELKVLLLFFVLVIKPFSSKDKLGGEFFTLYEDRLFLYLSKNRLAAGGPHQSSNENQLEPIMSSQAFHET